MKRMKLCAVAAVVLLAMGMTEIPAGAATSQTYGDLTYINYGGWIEILNCAEDVVTIEIPEKIDGVKVRDIGDNAFSGCSSLTTVTIPDCVENIGENAFSSCSSLTSITLPDSVKTIGRGAFGYCSDLEELELPAKLETLGDNVFYQCAGLTEMTIPQSVTSIGDRVFWECGNLIEIIVEEGNTAYSSENGILFDLAQTEILCYPAAKSDTSYSIPEGVNTVGTAAFYGCLNLEEIIIPETVTTIEKWGFYYCRGLKQIELPESVETIELAAFYGCTKMTAIYVPVSVTEVKNTAFGQCISLTDVYYGGSETDWAAMEVDDTMDMNAYFTGANIHYNATGIEPVTENLMGDVNNDGKFSLLDIIMLQKYLLCTGNLTAPQNADMCADGIIDAFDLAVMKRKLIEQNTAGTPDNMPVIMDYHDEVTDAERENLWMMLSDQYPDMDFSDFTFVYDPDHPLSDYYNGKLFSVYYKNILLHGYGNINCDANVFVVVGDTDTVNFVVDPKLFTEVDLEQEIPSPWEVLPTCIDTEQPELILYVDTIGENPPRLAYRAVEISGDAEYILDAVTGEIIEYIPYYVVFV